MLRYRITLPEYYANSVNRNPWTYGQVVRDTLKKEKESTSREYYIHETDIAPMFQKDKGELGLGDPIKCKIVMRLVGGVLSLDRWDSSHEIDFSQFFVQEWHVTKVLTTYNFENAKTHWERERAHRDALRRVPPQKVVMGDHDPSLVAAWNPVKRVVEYHPVIS